MKVDTPLTNVQIITGADGMTPGTVAMIIFNCPEVTVCNPETGQFQLSPAVQFTPRNAMEIGMNLIHVAKIAVGGATKIDSQELVSSPVQ